MIEINDNDLPITVAEKIIKGDKPIRDFGLNKFVDMFDLDEIKEIADYLIVYYEAHKE